MQQQPCLGFALIMPQKDFFLMGSKGLRKK